MKKLLFLPLFLFSYNYLGVGANYSTNGSDGSGLTLVSAIKKEDVRVAWNLGIYGYDDNTTIADLGLEVDGFIGNFYIGGVAHYLGINEESNDRFGFGIKSGYLVDVGENLKVEWWIEKIFVNNYHSILNTGVLIERKVDFSIDFGSSIL